MEKDTLTKPSAVRTREEALRSCRHLFWIAGLALAIILVISCGGDSGINRGAAVATPKDMAPDFSFTLYQGEVELGAEALELSELRGRPTVLNFWAGLCPPCRAELPDLQFFYEDFNDQVTVVGVDIGTFTGLGNQDDAKNLLRELEIAYPNGFTSDDTVVRRYQVLSMPTTFFINSKGEIFKKWNGALNRDILTEQTTELLNQESATRLKLGQE